MNTGQTFSYIVPFRNARTTLARTVESILRQNNVLELILVDDQSVDNPKEVTGPYEEKDARIKCVRNENHLGAGLSRNVGAEMAKGDTLVFVDADITIPEGAGRGLKDYFGGDRAYPRPDVIVGHRAKEELSGGFISKYKNYWTSYNFSKLMKWTSFLCSSFFAVKKNVFMETHGFRDMPCAEDNDLGYRLVARGYKIFFADDLAATHNKKFNLLSLLKREFEAGRNGIKVLIENKALGELVREKKFFAVNRNFIYSFPLAFVFVFCALLGVLFLQGPLLLAAALAAAALIFLNREFLAYGSCSKNYPKGVLYVLLMALQMHAIGLGLLLGLCELFADKITRITRGLTAHAGSLLKLFFKKAISPEQITFFMTHRCNLRCNHCFVPTNIAAKDRELSVSEIDRITKGMPRIKYVTLTGGEPFLREDLADWVGILNKNLRPYLITVLTNGYECEAVIQGTKKALKNCPKTNILIKLSLDGPPEIHDAMRQKTGAFDRARTTFAGLKALKRQHRNLDLGLITTYTDRNRNHIRKLFQDFILELKPDQYGLILERSTKANELSGTVNVDDYIEAQKEIYEKLFRSTKKLPGKFRLAYKMKIAEKMKQIFAAKKYPLKCFAGTLNAVVSPEGDVFACEQLHEKLGSLRDAGLDWQKVWRSPQAHRVRGFISEGKCFCTNECYMPFNITYDPRELFGVLVTLIKRSGKSRKG